MPVNEFVAVAARFSLSLTFVLAAVSKIGRQEVFQRAVRGFHLVPDRLVGSVARWVPWAELTAGLLLALGIWPRVVSAVLALALLTFSMGITVNLLRELGLGAAASAGSASR